MNAALQATLEFLKLYWAPLLCWRGRRRDSAADRRLHRAGGTQIMADMQARLGPMRVGPHGLLQPIADALKLLIKEDIIPEKRGQNSSSGSRRCFPVGAGLLSLAGLAIGPAFQIAQDINIGILFVVGISALGILAIVLGGWAFEQPLFADGCAAQFCRSW